MNASYLGMVVMIIISSFIFQNVTESNRSTAEGTSIEQQAKSFLLYVDSAQVYKNSNPAATGNITDKIGLPVWLPQNANVTVYAVTGLTFVYMPNKPGLITAIKNLTGDSSTFGLTKSGSIVTNYGSQTKPSAIPDNSLVYIL
ncbi:type IV pilus biogenesis protein PilM [Salmonella enterica]|nr:type IV pilus biogenesis protein PilM [Salmonella enterica]EEP3372981.1 type IV pilus biogenesis protein PilM [Salmonella enterica]EFP6579688.1 type IV pilus biogenesis protein PilM [Salmonella enterica]EGC7970970.1 type IV pilus biogenesis protein PilM [Salmonella enterica]EIV4461153.1 type IV pilus biogenesis protein PilM [Salmonella enterica]